MLLIKATVTQQSCIKNNGGGGGCYLKATVTQQSYNKINKQWQKFLLKNQLWHKGATLQQRTDEVAT